jgi:hypothetical protein
VLLDAVESLFKLGDERSFAGLETITSHDPPEIIAVWSLVRVVHSQQIFGRSACHQDDDVGLGGLVHAQSIVGDAICTKRKVVAVVDRPQDIEDEEAMSFFGGSEGDADESQG